MRKSEKLGLSRPYDWSNSNIDDDTLIYLVLQKHRFADVVRVCIYFGLPRVTAALAEVEDDYIASILQRMLKNIEEGLNS